MTVAGGLDNPGSTLTFNVSDLFNQNPGPSGIIDVDEDGLMDVGVDYFGIEGNVDDQAGNQFTGYTFSWQGKVFPIFQSNGSGYYVFADGFTSFTTGGTVTSNAWQAEAPTSLLCFLAETAIATPGGARAVETLAVGDDVVTEGGRKVPVKWIGRQTVSTRFGPAERQMPVRFAAGSLGDGLPHTDLTVTADHGMLVNGVICHAGALVNGTTITRVPLAEMGESFTVYHIETEEHEIILANGAPAETFIDNVSRRVFDNFAEFDALYGDVPEMVELPYPRAMSARQVPAAIREKLADRHAA